MYRQFKSMDDVAQHVVSLEAENRFLRWISAIAVIIAVCELASRFFR